MVILWEKGRLLGRRIRNEWGHKGKDRIQPYDSRVAAGGKLEGKALPTKRECFNSKGRLEWPEPAHPRTSRLEEAPCHKRGNVAAVLKCPSAVPHKKKKSAGRTRKSQWGTAKRECLSLRGQAFLVEKTGAPFRKRPSKKPYGIRRNWRRSIVRKKELCRLGKRGSVSSHHQP